MPRLVRAKSRNPLDVLGQVYQMEQAKSRSLQNEVARLKKEIDYFRELREGDFELTRALAEAAGIPITASNKFPGTQWEQFHDGVMKLKIELAECRRARDMDQVRNWPNHYREE